MCAASSSDWRELARLGEQLLGATSLAAQRDAITATTGRLLGAEADLWLHEKLLRPPDTTEPVLFSSEPSSQTMSRVLKAHGRVVKQKKGMKKKASRGTWAGVPLIDQGTTLGALLVTRGGGPDFKKEELNLLEGIAGIVAVSLVASHRVAVERFRLNQL